MFVKYNVGLYNRPAMFIDDFKIHTAKVNTSSSGVEDQTGDIF